MRIRGLPPCAIDNKAVGYIFHSRRKSCLLISEYTPSCCVVHEMAANYLVLQFSRVDLSSGGKTYLVRTHNTSDPPCAVAIHVRPSDEQVIGRILYCRIYNIYGFRCCGGNGDTSPSRDRFRVRFNPFAFRLDNDKQRSAVDGGGETWGDKTIGFSSVRYLVFFFTLFFFSARTRGPEGVVKPTKISEKNRIRGTTTTTRRSVEACATGLRQRCSGDEM